jgi:DNA-binding Lrp family transcriptional regulator
MEIKLSEKQFRRLLDLVYIGNWVLNSTRGDDRIRQYDEVESVYLMSGGYDLFVTISGRSFKEVAMFVAKRLSTLEGVTSTATHFVLKKYKDNGVILHKNDPDERGNASL